jgi:hypothetical protein
MGGSDRGPPGHTSPAGPKWHAPGFSTPFLPRASFPPAPPAPCHASVCGGVAGAGGPNTAGNGEIYGTCSSTVSTPPSLTCTLRIILKTVKDSGTAAEVGVESLGCKKRGGEALADANWGKGGRGRATVQRGQRWVWMGEGRSTWLLSWPVQRGMPRWEAWLPERGRSGEALNWPHLLAGYPLLQMVNLPISFPAVEEGRAGPDGAL